VGTTPEAPAIRGLGRDPPAADLTPDRRFAVACALTTAPPWNPARELQLRPTAGPLARALLILALGCAAEVFGGDGVEELAKLLDLVFLLVRDGHARLVEDLLAGVDGRAGAQGEGDGI
jgi:hypothetical protein